MEEKRRIKEEWRQQEEWERRRQADREGAMIEIKCFVYRDFGYIAHHYRNRKDIEENRIIEVGEPKYWPSSNKFKILTSRIIIKTDIPNKGKEKKKKFLKEVTVKIELKQEDEKDRIMVNALLDSGVIGLVMSSKFSRKYKFKKKKLFFFKSAIYYTEREGRLWEEEARKANLYEEYR